MVTVAVLQGWAPLDFHGRCVRVCWGSRYLTDPKGTLRRQADLARHMSSMSAEMTSPALSDMFGAGNMERARSTDRCVC
jgi:hypothetical protein